jgi:hypothetical protein
VARREPRPDLLIDAYAWDMTALDNFESHGRKVIARSSDSPAACSSRLEANLAPASVAARLDRVFERQFVGHVRGDDVVVWPIGPTSVDGRPVWHLWTPVFQGRLMSVGSGTNLVGRIALNRFIPIFGVVLAVILAGWLWVGIDATVGHMQQGKAIDSGFIFAALLMPALFGLFHGFFYYVGYRLFVRDRIELIVFLRGALASPDQTGTISDPSR